MKKRSFTQSSTWQILFGDTIVPRCVPLPYRAYLLTKKLQRSCGKRVVGKRRGPTSPSPAQAPADSSRVPPDSSQAPPDPSQAQQDPSPREPFVKETRLGGQTLPLINKTLSALDEDLSRPDVAVVVKDLERLRALLEKKGCRPTSAAGSFKQKDFVPLKERYKLWENAWLLTHMPPAANEKILDVGGASTLFSFYLAWKGARVSVVDNDWGLHGLIYNARHVARVLGWPMTVVNRDLCRPLPFTDASFDKVFCVCVLEHLSPAVRARTMTEIHRVLKPGGLCGLTIDYDEGRCDPGMDQGLRFGFPAKLQKEILAPSRLTLWGNQALADDCPSGFFLGALFLRKG